MEPFTILRAPAVAVPGANIDTDQILPARFLSKPRAGGFAQYLFHDLRFNEDGDERPGFPLNRPERKAARILVGGENFGCGSSRENAVWAICDYGFRAVIAPSFGDIFSSNSLKNGLLPVVLQPAEVASIIETLQGAGDLAIEIDLAAQQVIDPAGAAHPFPIDPFSKDCLLNGVDELDYTLSQMDRIDEFERRRADENDWPAPPRR